MTFKIQYSKQSVKALAFLEKSYPKAAKGFSQKFQEICASENPFVLRELSIESVSGLKDHFKIRSGSYRAVFCIENKIILIRYIERRDEVYRKSNINKLR